MKNIDLRVEISESGLKYKEIAAVMGITPRWLSNIMRYDLTPENHDRIIQAIEVLLNKREQKEWNLGDGLPNVCNSILRKLNAAGWRLEDGPRTILNVDSYEVTVMYLAVKEYMEKRGIKHEN